MILNMMIQCESYDDDIWTVLMCTKRENDICDRIYIYNAEFIAAVMIVHETVEIEGNEFRQSKYFNLLELPSKVRLTY